MFPATGESIMLYNRASFTSTIPSITSEPACSDGMISPSSLIVKFAGFDATMFTSLA